VQKSQLSALKLQKLAWAGEISTERGAFSARTTSLSARAESFIARPQTFLARAGSKHARAVIFVALAAALSTVSYFGIANTLSSIGALTRMSFVLKFA
jgi:hypothetical protein